MTFLNCSILAMIVLFSILFPNKIVLYYHHRCIIIIIKIHLYCYNYYHYYYELILGRINVYLPFHRRQARRLLLLIKLVALVG